MIYDRDKELIEKLELNAKGEYNRFSNGDIEYLIFTIKRCAKLEDICKENNITIYRKG